MNRLTLDESLPQALAQLQTCAELCDRQGNVVGYFTPASTPPGPVFEREYTDEELDQRAANAPTYSTAEVKAYLQGL